MGRRRNGEPVSGWICLDKPLDMGSTEAVTKVRRLFNAQKAGHAGTLDPLATGVLPIALGEATKTVPFLMEADKVYRFTVVWGATTASFDREGEVTATSDARPDPDQVAAALPRFVGEIDQIPPNYSAIKVDGQRAYDLAREGVALALKPRRVTIHSAKLVDAVQETHGDAQVEIEVHCGKGVYVRAIVRDLAVALGACGHVGALRRLRVGRFSIDDATGLEKLVETVQDDHSSEVLLPVETALDDIPALALTTEDAFRLKQGRSIVLLPRQVEALRARLVPRTVGGQDVSRTVLTTHQGRAQALCELRAGRLNPTRIFHLDQES